MALTVHWLSQPGTPELCQPNNDSRVGSENVFEFSDLNGLSSERGEFCCCFALFSAIILRCLLFLIGYSILVLVCLGSILDVWYI